MNHASRSTRALPATPNLEQLRRQAKELLAAFRHGDAEAVAEICAHCHGADASRFTLADAQLVLARAYGFDSWPKLKRHVDGLNAQEFIRAVHACDLALVESMLKQRPDLADMQWSYGDERRALHHAVVMGSVTMVELLLAHGADARAGVHPHRDATTAHVMASERGQRTIVALIEAEEARRRRAKPANEPAKQSVTSNLPPDIDHDLVQAVARGDLAWLRARHVNKPLRNVIDWNSGGLLTLAALREHKDVLEFLLTDCGFDPDERVRWSEGPQAAWSQGYPLWHCAAHGKRELAELLLRHGADPNVHVDSSGSPVYAGYSHRQWAMVELLKAHGGLVTPDIAGLYRETAAAKAMLEGVEALPPEVLPAGRALEEHLLEFALSGGAADIVAMALARIDWPRSDRRWFRMLARGLDFWHHMPGLQGTNAAFDRASYLDGFRLLAARCDPNLAGGWSRTALHEVAAAGAHVGDAEVIALTQILLEVGATVGQRDELLQSTALGWACRWGRVGVVRLLLEHGADPREMDGEPFARPRAWARKKGNGSVLGVLEIHGG